MFGYLLPQGLLLNALRNILFDWLNASGLSPQRLELYSIQKTSALVLLPYLLLFLAN
jgi:hypothetical protein